jgi:nucleoside-diphosphate-sugar epimerase
MNIVLSGATGFIGSHLVPALLKAGHKAAILKRASSDLKNLKAFKNDIPIYHSDTYSDIYAGIRDFSPDIVIHAAAWVVFKPAGEKIAELIYSNITFGTQILDAMAENNITNFVNIGTYWQHLENQRYNPSNLYAATKEAFKDIILYYEKRGIQHKTLELYDTFGTGDSRKKIMDLLITACRNREGLDLTPGEQVLDLTYIGDICNFLVSNIGTPAFFDNGTVLISGTPIRLRDLGTMIEKKFNTPGLFHWGAKPYREQEVMIPPSYFPKIQLNPDSLQSYIDNLQQC